MADVRVGVDVGGTNTDAVVMAGRTLLGWAKTPTTGDVTGGIVASVREALARAETAPAAVRAVMVGTTHFTNAVVERRRLEPTAAVRLGLPATASVPPFADWPADLRAAIDGQGYLAHGGYEYDGRPIAPLDEAELRALARQIQRRGATALAICAVFSPIRPDLEQQAAAIFQEEIPGLRISLSHEIGRLGLLERENACILNACLSGLAATTVTAIGGALHELALDAAVYLSQNDGTLMSAEFARRYPVLTFASGPTNSMRGAAYLSGLRDAIVVDVGGTTSDVGALVGGFPREASLAVEVGGVRTNFRMPDLLTLGIGGGSMVRPGTGDGPPTIGPESVGYQLTERGVVFGGDVLTATDAAVATGLATLGDVARLSPERRALAPAAMAEIRRRLAEAIDQVKISAAEVPVVLVGGGSILVDQTLPGASTVIRPDHFAVANAIGAAIGQVSGEVDQVHSLEGTSRAEVMARARDDAAARAVAAGADPETIEVVDADGMGRAFPELQMVTFFIYGVPPCPAAIADDKGEEAVFTAAPSPRRLERMARVLVVEMGGTAGMAFAPMRGTDLKRTAIPRTLSVARDVGQTVRAARARNADPVEALLAATGGSLLLVGKIVDVERRTGGGFARGTLNLVGSGSCGGTMRIDFQNENLVAYADGVPVATVPDLICIVSTDAAEPITTELLRYGQRVSVVGIRCHPLLSTPEALAVVGPAAFGYDVEYRPLEPGGPLPWTTLS